jgi:hypothetical protein
VKLKSAQLTVSSVNGLHTELAPHHADLESRSERESALRRNMVESRALMFHFLNSEHARIKNAQLMVKSVNGLHSEVVRSLVGLGHNNEPESALRLNTVENHVPMFNYLKRNRARSRNVQFTVDSLSGHLTEPAHNLADLEYRSTLEYVSSRRTEGILVLENLFRNKHARLRNAQSML